MLSATAGLPLLGWMGTLADPTRLRLLLVLAEEELGVTELCEVLGLPQSTVSRHLKQLAEQGWVRQRRRGTSRLYRVAGGVLSGGEFAGLWELLRSQSETWATAREDRLRLTEHLRRRDAAEAFFAAASGHWETLRREIYGEGYLRAAALGLLPAEWSVADLGCGTGELTAALGAQVARVCGVDRSPEMLAAARRRAAGLPNVELREGLLSRLPLGDGEFDAALMLLVLSYQQDPPAALAEAVRILRPGGRLVLVDLLRHDREDFRERMGQIHSGFEPGVLLSWLGSCGMKEDQSTALPAEPGADGASLLLITARKDAAGRSDDRQSETDAIRP